MPKFNTFGIFENSIRELIEDIIASGATLTSKEVLTDFIYEQGIEAFCSGEFIAISDDLIPYLKKEREYPPCFLSQVLGNKFKGFIAMRAKLLINFPQTETAGDSLEDIYDSFMREAIESNNDFYQIEAKVRSGLKEHAKKTPDIITEVSNFIDYFLFEYKKILADCDNPTLREKIQAHINFISELTQLDLYTPKSKAILVPTLGSQLSLQALPLLPGAIVPKQLRSKSSDDKPSVLGNTLFGLRKTPITETQQPLIGPPRTQSL